MLDVSQLFFKVECSFFACISHILFIHPSVDGQLGYFHTLAIVNTVTVNIGVQIFL